MTKNCRCVPYLNRVKMWGKGIPHLGSTPQRQSKWWSTCRPCSETLIVLYAVRTLASSHRTENRLFYEYISFSFSRYPVCDSVKCSNEYSVIQLMLYIINFVAGGENPLINRWLGNGQSQGRLRWGIPRAGKTCDYHIYCKFIMI